MTKVLKFGGTSVGSAENMRRVAEIMRSEGATVTVMSAMSGVTDLLIKITGAAENKDSGRSAELMRELEARFAGCIDSLLTGEYRESGMALLAKTVEDINAQTSNFSPVFSGREIVARGELLTTAVFTLYMHSAGLKARLLHAPDFVFTDESGRVDTARLEKDLRAAAADPDTFYITQGFICTGPDGRIDNLGRGGSDYSAALMGAAIGAGAVQIWTDIDGMHNNDPRIVSNTHPIRQMSFEEAAELAYFGAKILHPATIQPCKDKNIPVYLKNTMDPSADGTKIFNGEKCCAGGFRAVAAKDNITVIRICSTRMLMAYGFLRRVFEIFEEYRTPIDMITTSEVAVSLTVDNDAHLAEIEAKLQDFGTIRVERNNTIVCIVGQCSQKEHGMAARIFDALSDIPLKMISYGASERSVALLVDTEYKKPTLQHLNDSLFDA